MNIKLDIPYPEIMVEAPSIEYAKILMKSYAGSISEDTAVHLYMFEHLSLDKKYEYYSKIFKQIAVVEMKHLDMLGKTIRLLGVEPVFASYNDNKNCLIPWKSIYVKYNFNIKDMIDENIKSEENAIKQYRETSKIIKDKYIVNLINRIIMDEELHLKIFNELKNMLKEK